MRNLVFNTTDNILKVEIKTDIFSTKEDLTTQGHDTNFTQMYIDNIPNQCIVFGLDFRELVYTWQSLIKFAKDTGFGLLMLDESGNEEIVAPAKSVTSVEYNDSIFNGTVGKNYITFNNGKIFESIKEKDVIVIDNIGYQIQGFDRNKWTVSFRSSLHKTFVDTKVNLITELA